MARDGAQAPKGGCFKKMCFGCLTVVLLLAVGGFLAYRGVKGALVRMTAQYTEAAPVELPAVTPLPEAERNALYQRVDAFAKAVRAGEARQIGLTAREINALVQKSPELAGRLHVEIDGDRIRGDASVPLDQIVDAGFLKGRWLNGSVGLSVSTVAGRLVVFMDELSVRGKPVPAQMMSMLRTKNLAEKAMENPKAAAVLRRIESVRVEDGRIVISAK